jgi:diacylglycerol kinase family enzyme
VRIALIANEASGGGLDPQPLVATMRRSGAEVSVCGCDLEGVPDGDPERIAVAGGDGTIGDCAELADGQEVFEGKSWQAIVAVSGAFGGGGVRHARGRVIEVDLPPGTEFNVDGEVRDAGGMQRITVEHDAFELVVG